MKKLIIGLIVISSILIIILMFLNKKEDKSILYSWSMETITDKELLTIIDKHDIDTLYQDFSTEYLSLKDNAFIIKMESNDVDVFHLCGEKEWGYEENAESLKKEIDKVLNYNKSNKYKIKGIVFDIEPYQNEKNIENFDFSLYVSILKKAYAYANSNNLKMVIAIPIWFDSIDKKLLEELISDACDEISLMSYNIKYTKEHMKEEIKLAKKYNKKINTIYEINFGEDNYFSNYREIEEDFNKIKNEYQYSNLKKAYHYYEMMKEN